LVQEGANGGQLLFGIRAGETLQVGDDFIGGHLETGFKGALLGGPAIEDATDERGAGEGAQDVEQADAGPEVGQRQA